jgi:cobalt-zinc-cadmium efflux system protein
VVLRLRETIHLFLQGVPKKLQLVPVQKQLEAWPEIGEIKHLRIWSLDGKAHVCTATVVLVQPLAEAEQQALKKKLVNYFEALDCKEITLAFSILKNKQ